MVKDWILRILGQKSHRLEIGIKTQFRGRKNTLFLPEWQEIAEVFKKTPDLEDFLRIQLDLLSDTLRNAPITEDGDRQRLVMQAQAEVLQDMLNLPEKAAAKVKEMLKPKSVLSLKGNEHVY